MSDKPVIWEKFVYIEREVGIVRYLQLHDLPHPALDIHRYDMFISEGFDLIRSSW